MLLNGRKACDGHIEEIRCAQCWIQSRGLPTPLAFAVSRLPRMSFSGTGWTSNVTWRGATMLSARSLVDNHARELQAMSELSERIVAPSLWVYDALAINGVPLEKLSISRQAVAQSLVDRGRAVPGGKRGKGKELTIGFMGRLEPYKGAHLLLEAVKRIPRDVPVRLKVAGSGTEPEYLRSIERIADRDKRIEFLGPLEHDEISQFLRSLDVLAVPSNYMETGPLVVLEAYAFVFPSWVPTSAEYLNESATASTDGCFLSTTAVHGLPRSRTSRWTTPSSPASRRISCPAGRWTMQLPRWPRSIARFSARPIHQMGRAGYDTELRPRARQSQRGTALVPIRRRAPPLEAA